MPPPSQADPGRAGGSKTSPDQSSSHTVVAFSAKDTDDPFLQWRVFLDGVFHAVPLKGREKQSHEASFKAQSFGSFLYCESRDEGGRYQRSDTGHFDVDLDHIVISHIRSGRIVIASPAIRRIRPGDVTVVDLSAPATFMMHSTAAVHLVMPRTLLPESVAPSHTATCRIVGHDTAMGAFLKGILDALSISAALMNPAEVATLGRSIPGLIGSCLAHVAPADPGAGPASSTRRLRRHIEENLHKRDLVPTKIARDVGMSRTQLYRNFVREGGVEAYIRKRRMRRSLMAICDPARGAQRIGDISHEMGFDDEAHFSRLFRKTFGVSPREARNGASQMRDQNPLPGAGKMTLAALLDLLHQHW